MLLLGGNEPVRLRLVSTLGPGCGGHQRSSVPLAWGRQDAELIRGYRRFARWYLGYHCEVASRKRLKGCLNGGPRLVAWTLLGGLGKMGPTRGRPGKRSDPGERWPARTTASRVGSPRRLDDAMGTSAVWVKLTRPRRADRGPVQPDGRPTQLGACQSRR